MNESDWSQRLAERRSSLSRRELDLIEWIIANPHEAAFDRLQSLAEKAAVSKPTVISSYRKLGYPDYQTFQEAIQRFYAGQIDSYRAGAVALRELGSSSELLGACIDVEIAALETLRKNIRAEELDALAAETLEAREVFIYGGGTGFYPGHYLVQRLRRCGLTASLTGTDREHALDELGPIRGGDLFLSFFYTQDSLALGTLLDFARGRGARTALVAGFLDPDLCRRADRHLFVPRGHIRFKNSMAVPMAFAQILLMAIEFKGGERIAERLRLLEMTRKGIVAIRMEEKR